MKFFAVHHPKAEEGPLQADRGLDRADAVDVARVAVFQHQGVPGFLRRDAAFEGLTIHPVERVEEAMALVRSLGPG